jgi:hypothetical protein
VHSPTSEQHTLIPTKVLYEALLSLESNKNSGESCWVDNSDIDIFFNYIDTHQAVDVIKCPKCLRLWVHSPEKKTYESFGKEKVS